MGGSSRRPDSPFPRRDRLGFGKLSGPAGKCAWSAGIPARLPSHSSGGGGAAVSAAGALVLIGDPQRSYFPRGRFERLAEGATLRDLLDFARPVEPRHLPLDLVDVARMLTADPNHRVPHLAFQPDALQNTPILPMAEVTTSYYLRLAVADQAGVLADITRILAAHGVSIDALLQKEAAEGESQTDLVILTHETKEKNMLAALHEMQDLKTVIGEIVKIRLENLS